ncbi:hypothetical protein GCM10010321_42620 [Streptomyces chartreusis]|nr:hypothetical protein [Streptomyces chartreusis]QEV71784.1 hypothetical protein CP983_37485 [Streptomyces chartreusis]GGX23480.1 hypothetical protein GCM10010321_42620 [Streptomyces chartreusis]
MHPLCGVVPFGGPGDMAVGADQGGAQLPPGRRGPVERAGVDGEALPRAGRCAVRREAEEQVGVGAEELEQPPVRAGEGEVGGAGAGEGVGGRIRRGVVDG